MVKLRETTFVFDKKGRIRAENKKALTDLRELKRILFEAQGCYELWWTYLQVKSKTEYFHVLLNFKDFFEITARAYISNLVISLYKLYDGGNKVLNIGSLIKETENILDSNEKQHIQGLMNKAKPIWGKVAKLRSNLFAHRSNQLTRDEIYKMAQITPNQLRDLIDLSLEILNVISAKLHEPIGKFEHLEGKDMNKILTALGCKLE